MRGLRLRFLFFSALTFSGSCFSQNLCSIPANGHGFSPPQSQDAYAVLDAIGQVVPFETRTIKLFPSSDILVTQKGGAAAKLCDGIGGTERWIFFDPKYIESLKTYGGNDSPRYFVLAHEAAHHINRDTLAQNWTKDQELRADFSAAFWLARLGVTREELLQTFDKLGLPPESVNGYPTRAERRAMVTLGFEKSMAQTAGGSDATSKRRAALEVAKQSSAPVRMRHSDFPCPSPPCDDMQKIGTKLGGRVADRIGQKGQAVKLEGYPGFKPFSGRTAGLLGHPVLDEGPSELDAEGHVQSIYILYGGAQIATLSCKGLSVDSGGVSARDTSGAEIPSVIRVTLSSSNGSFTYYSSKQSSQPRITVRQSLSSLCSN